MAEQVIKGMLIPIEGGAPLRFQWNPDVVRGPGVDNQWAEMQTPGRAHPFQMFAGGKAKTIAFDLMWIDHFNSGADVVAAWNILEDMWNVRPIGFGSVRPSRVILRLGSFMNEVCVPAGLTPNFTIGRGGAFSRTLLPDPAIISITLKVWRG